MAANQKTYKPIYHQSKNLVITSTMKTTAEKRKETYKILAKNRYASRPEHISPQQWGNIRKIMYGQYMREFMATTPGLYTDSQIWHQTFAHLLK